MKVSFTAHFTVINSIFGRFSYVCKTVENRDEWLTKIVNISYIRFLIHGIAGHSLSSDKIMVIEGREGVKPSRRSILKITFKIHPDHATGS